MYMRRNNLRVRKDLLWGVHREEEKGKGSFLDI